MENFSNENKELFFKNIKTIWKKLENIVKEFGPNPSSGDAFFEIWAPTDVDMKLTNGRIEIVLPQKTKNKINSVETEDKLTKTANEFLSSINPKYFLCNEKIFSDAIDNVFQTGKENRYSNAEAQKTLEENFDPKLENEVYNIWDFDEKHRRLAAIWERYNQIGGSKTPDIDELSLRSHTKREERYNQIGGSKILDYKYQDNPTLETPKRLGYDIPLDYLNMNEVDIELPDFKLEEPIKLLNISIDKVIADETKDTEFIIKPFDEKKLNELLKAFRKNPALVDAEKYIEGTQKLEFDFIKKTTQNNKETSEKKRPGGGNPGGL